MTAAALLIFYLPPFLVKYSPYYILMKRLIWAMIEWVSLHVSFRGKTQLLLTLEV